jgi:hypothetical protein
MWYETYDPLEEWDPPKQSVGFTWLVGPGSLGGNVGLVSGTAAAWAALMVFSDIAGLTLWLLTLLAGGCGWFGGFVGGLTARDEYLREDWSRCRGLVGLLMGGLAGAFFAMDLCNSVVFVGGGVGGALGGLADALVHRNTLEECD